MRNYQSCYFDDGKWIYKQEEDFARDARRHVRRIRSRWEPPENFFHFRRGGHVAAMQRHLEYRRHGKIDLSGFFSHVVRYRISRCLTKLGYSFREADDIAIASTVCVNRQRQIPAGQRRIFALPFGFVQSPLLAAVALDRSDLGRTICRLHDQGAVISVYVDDIIVSAETDEAVQTILAELETAADKSNFPVNKAKSEGPSAAIKAFNIVVDPTGMEIAGARLEEMRRAILHNGVSPRTDGILNYVRSVNTSQADDIVTGFPSIFPRPQP